MQAPCAHPGDEILERYCLGTLTEPEAETVEEHLLVCPACQDRQNDTDAYVRAMQAAARRIRAQPSRSSFTTLAVVLSPPRLAGVMGTVLCLLLLVWFFEVRRSPVAANSQSVAVALRAQRGVGEESAVARAPKNRPLLLEADLGGLPLQGGYTLEVVDALGRSRQRSAVTAAGARLALAVPAGLGRGSYWVRLYSSSPESDLLREYAMLVE